MKLYNVTTMVKKRVEPAQLEEREFRSMEEIDSAIAKLKRRIRELEELNLQEILRTGNAADEVAASNIRATIREIFGMNSQEFREHEYLSLWAGPLYANMSPSARYQGKEHGRKQALEILKGLVGRLREKQADLSSGGGGLAPSTYFDRLNLHPRIREVSRQRFIDGYPWDAVFAASKALVNYVKERSGRYDLDGAQLMRTVFSKNAPILALNDLSDPTDLDEQEGMMHLFEGAALGIRNPGGHSFPEGTDQRAMEYISLLSLLAYRVQEARFRKMP